MQASATVQGLVKKLNQLIWHLQIKLLWMEISHRSQTTETINGLQASQTYLYRWYHVNPLSKLSGIPVEKLTQADSKKYLNLEKSSTSAWLVKMSLFQPSVAPFVAINLVFALVNGQSALSCFGPNVSVGKQNLPKPLARNHYDESALFCFDMSEYMEKFVLVTSSLTVPLLDMLATKKVANWLRKFVTSHTVLLWWGGKGSSWYFQCTFTSSRWWSFDGIVVGRKVDFSNTIIIMTSNLGATALRDDKTVGFGARDFAHDHVAMEKRILEELKKLIAQNLSIGLMK